MNLIAGGIFLFGSDGKRIAAATAIRAQLARTRG